MVHGSWFMAVWLTQQQMAELFNTTRNNITLHIGNIFKEGELEVNSVRKESLLTAADEDGTLSASVPCEAANLFAPYSYFNVVVHVLLFLVCLHLVWPVHTVRQEFQGEYQRCHQQSL